LLLVNAYVSWLCDLEMERGSPLPAKEDVHARSKNVNRLDHDSGAIWRRRTPESHEHAAPQQRRERPWECLPHAGYAEPKQPSRHARGNEKGKLTRGKRRDEHCDSKASKDDAGRLMTHSVRWLRAWPNAAAAQRAASAVRWSRLVGRARVSYSRIWLWLHCAALSLF
jgi:hypothetical protein